MLHREPSEPQPTLPIEDQLLEAIISASLPAPSEASTDTDPSGPNPNRNRNPNLPSAVFPSPLDLASRFQLPLSRVLDILANPLTRTRLAAAQELRDLDFHQREQRARDKALTALESILDTSEDPIEKRRAATAILRRNSARNPFWPRIPGGGATTLDLDEDADEDAAPPRTPLPAPEFPQWTRPPRDNLIRLLTRLQDNHNPRPNAGLTTLFNHKHDSRNLRGDERQDAIEDYLDDPGQDAELTGFSCAILHAPDSGPNPNRNPNPNLPSAPTSSSPTPTPIPNPPSALCPAPSPLCERITLHWPDYRRTVRFHFTNTGNRIASYWQISHIDIGPKDTSTPDSS